MIRYKKLFEVHENDKVITSKPCKNYRYDTEQCRTGCKHLKLKPGDICPFYIRADTSKGEEAQEFCLCYKK